MRARLDALGVPGVRVLARSTRPRSAQLRFFAAEPPRQDPRLEGAAAPPHRQHAARRRTASGPAADLATEIEWAKNRRIAPDDYLRSLGDHEPPIPADLMARVYREYERRKADQGCVDFEDLLELTIRLFDADAGALERCATATARSRSTSTRTSTCSSRRCSTAGSATGTSCARSATTTSRSTRSPARAPSTCSGCRSGFRMRRSSGSRRTTARRRGARVREPARPGARRRREGAARDASCGARARRALVRGADDEAAFVVERVRELHATARRTRRWRSSSGRTRAPPTSRRRSREAGIPFQGAAPSSPRRRRGGCCKALRGRPTRRRAPCVAALEAGAARERSRTASASGR